MPTPTPSSAGVSARMARQRRRDTDPELAVRRLLHTRGLRYRVAWPVPGMRRRTIDVAFTAARLAVFVDGCFWHGCPQHATWPRANRDWWAAKIGANRARDAETTGHLHASGWTVLRFWEHDAAADAADLIDRTLSRLRPRHGAPPSTSYTRSVPSPRPDALDGGSSDT